MKNILISFFIILISVSAAAQNSDSTLIGQKNKIITDSSSGKPMLIGYCTRDAFKDTSFSWWFESIYDMYDVDSVNADKFADKLKDDDIMIVMGTWCSDSRREVPRLYKILDYLKYPADKIKLIMVDRDKNALGDEIKDLNIKLVPTIIFYNGNRELGRIAESPKESLEKDILKIVESK